MGGVKQIPKIESVYINKISDNDEQERINKVKDILTTMMAEYAVAKAKGRI